MTLIKKSEQASDILTKIVFQEVQNNSNASLVPFLISYKRFATIVSQIMKKKLVHFLG